MTTDELLAAICDALGREPGTLSLDDTPDTVDEWDSVGTLSIIATIDEELRVPMDDKEMRNFKSMRELVDRLKARNAIED